MAERVPQSVAYVVVFRCYLASDGKTPATGKTIAITLSKNGATSFSNPNAGATNATEMASGFYKFTLDTTDTGTVGPLAWRGTNADINDAGDVLSVVKATNGGFSALPDAAAEAAGGLYTRGTGAGQINQAANGMIDTSIVRIDNVAQSLTDLKDLVDTGYDPVAHKVAGVVLTDTLTTYTGNTVQTGDSFARIGATGSGLTTLATAANLAVVDGIVDDILLDTAEIGAAGAGLTNINLPNQTMDIVGNITGNLSGSVGSVTGLTASNLDVAVSTRMATYTQPTGFLTASFPTDPADHSLVIAATDALATLIGDVPTNAELATALGTADDATLAAIAALNNLSAAQVNAEVDAALVDVNLDHLVKIAVDTDFATTVHLNSVLGYMADNGTSATFDRTTDSLEAIRDKEIDIETDTQDIQTKIGVAGAGLTAIGDARIANLDTTVSSRASQTSVDDVPTNAELAASQASADDATLAAIAALNNISVAQVNAEMDTALADIHLDHLLATTYDPASKPGIADALLNELVESDAGVSRFTANALEQSPSGGGLDAAGVRAAVGLASANLDTQFGDLPTNAELATALGTADDAVLAQVALVKAKTDLIPASPASVGSAMTLTSGERDSIATALLDLANGIESGKTLRQAMRLMAATLAGKRSNAGTPTEQYDAIGNVGTARVVGNLNENGDGTPTLTP